MLILATTLMHLLSEESLQALPLSRMDERFCAWMSRATGLVLLDLLQFDCGVKGRSVSALDASVPPPPPPAYNK